MTYFSATISHYTNGKPNIRATEIGDFSRITSSLVLPGFLMDTSLRSRRIKGRERGRKKSEERGGGNACYKSCFLCISAYCFTVIGLTELSVQLPIRIRRALFCTTDFNYAGRREKIFIAASIVRKSSSRVMSATPTKVCKRGRKPKIDIQKNSSCRFCRVNFTSGGGRASFENRPPFWLFLQYFTNPSHCPINQSEFCGRQQPQK